MAKLLEIVTSTVKRFPKGYQRFTQRSDGWLIVASAIGGACEHSRVELAEDRETAVVTRAQWEAERARIATNQQATQEAREIAQGDGKHSKEDQALWDKVAIAAINACADEFGCRNPKHIATLSFDMADAFMAERAKRMKG